MREVRVIVRCVACRATREIGPDEIPPGEVPMCEACFSPMVPEFRPVAFAP